MADAVHSYAPHAPLPDGVRIRLATVTDVDAMAELRRRMFTEMHERGGASAPWTAEERSARIAEATAAFAAYAESALPAGHYVSWLAEAEGQAIGSAALAVSAMPPTPGNAGGRIGTILKRPRRRTVAETGHCARARRDGARIRARR